MTALALWLPWVNHRAAALVLTGLDLPEFVRFMGTAAAPLVRPMQIAFAAPLLVAALVLSAWVWSNAFSLWFRAAVLVLGLWLASVAFSPLERGGEFLLAGAAVVAVWVASAALRPSSTVVRWAAGLGGAASGLATLWQFSRAAPVLGRLYGPISWGAGPWLLYLVVLAGVEMVAAAVVRRRRNGSQRITS